MLKKISTPLFLAGCVVVFSSAYRGSNSGPYADLYYKDIADLKASFTKLTDVLAQANLSTTAGKNAVFTQLYLTRKVLKKSDLWTRYLEATTYRALNGPLPVEWEVEVFEKLEKPYRRPGYGLSVFENALDSGVTNKDSLKSILTHSINALPVYTADSVTQNLGSYDHFFLCNRLFLLNLAAIYTTGFECPNNDSIIPELQTMLDEVNTIYIMYNQSFKSAPIKDDYFIAYSKLRDFVRNQPRNFEQFDNYTYLRDYVNPLFALNQQYIRDYNVTSHSFNDYTLSNDVNSVFDKNLYAGQNVLGIYSGVKDQKVITEIKAIGKLLFYDPILSGNNERSCASCHKPTEHYTDTSVATALNFNDKTNLPRNTPSLLNVIHNHLLMLDGKHISLQNQARGVITSPNEMGGKEDEVVQKVMSCKEYKEAFEKFKNYTYKNKEVTFDHIISAITAYEGDFSDYTAPFDDAMNKKTDASAECKQGFNLFMGKAQCGTCHYVPMFSGIRPPYVESEFEVIGVPTDKNATALSNDSGRADIYYSKEMLHAFRTNTVRNSSYTKPYMHNGVFTTMRQVIDFYNAGGGAGKGLKVPNQSLSPKPLHLTEQEITELLTFIKSLDEDVTVQTTPDHLPVSKIKELNNRKVGGVY
jgi:cytochrome c peroxidase